MIIALLVVAVIAMIVVKGFLVAAETAIASLSHTDMEELADEGGRGAKAVRNIAKTPDAHVSALSFLRVLLTTASVVLVTLLLSQKIDEPWIVFLVAASIMLVVAFIVTGASPRSLAHARPKQVLRSTAWIARAARVSIGFLADLLVLMGNRVTPTTAGRSTGVTSEEQLLSMVDEATEYDVLDEGDRELIHSVFEFTDTLVREAMVARTDMVTVDGDSSVREALDAFLEHGISRAPVVGKDSDDIRGVLYLKDLTQWYIDHPLDSQRVTVAALTRPAMFVPETVTAGTLLTRMRAETNHFAMVVDEYGGIAGLITLEDVIEELVGEINDEFDREDDEATDLGSGLYRVPSRMATDDVGELFDLEIRYEDVDSIGGLLSKTLGKVLQRGDHAVVDGLDLSAERVGRRGRVTTLLVRLADEASEGASVEGEGSHAKDSDEERTIDEATTLLSGYGSGE